MSQRFSTKVLNIRRKSMRARDSLQRRLAPRRKYTRGTHDAPGAQQLVEAIRNQDNDAISSTVNAANVNSTLALQGGSTPLHYCCRILPENPEGVKILIEAGAHVNAYDEAGETPLHVAILKGSKESVKILLNDGLVPVAKPTKGGESPLHIATHHDHAGIVQILIDTNADVNVRDVECFQTPLHAAAEFYKLKSAKILLANDANVNVFDWRGKSPLHHAAESDEHQGSVELINMLLRKGADPCVPDYLEEKGSKKVMRKPSECCKDAESEAYKVLVDAEKRAKGDQPKRKKTPNLLAVPTQ
eukprot:m.89785 g.89785  ORF g.89785 m.89785 type:complete len:302 (+) comp13240_c0_seq1:159-1064(+)